MINLAVIELKDIIKYLVRITIFITIIIVITRYFFSIKTNMQTEIQVFSEQTFLSCLDTAIPAIKEVNSSEEESLDYNEEDSLKVLLKVELGAIDSLKLKESSAEDTESIVEEETNSIAEEEAETEEELAEAETDVETEVQESSVSESYTIKYGTVKIKNETDIELTEEMLKPDVDDICMDNILIYHTHSCESYTQTEEYTYEASGNFRTTNKERSVIRVGTELTNYLTSYGYNVIHDTSLYDYPSYNGSYNRSYSGVAKLLEQNEGTEVLFDIHRDAISDSTYAPTVKIGDEYAAQLMFVIGSNGSGLEHDNWERNLQFAIKIQEKANELYPGLFKPIILRNSRYNQQLADGASIIEVGATGNTLEECLVSMKYLAKVISELE